MQELTTFVAELSHEDRVLLRDLLIEADIELNQIVQTAFLPSDEADVLDRAYRRVHFVLGFCELLGITPAVCALDPADKALDVARVSGDFKNSSLDYVVKLSIETTLAILREVSNTGACEVDLSDILEECNRFLAPRLAAARAQEPEQRAEPRLSEPLALTGPASPPPTARQVEEARPPDVLISDEDETLDLTAEQTKLVPDFCAEARENLERMTARLLDLEEAGGGEERINDLFRAIHTVKGGARLLTVRKMERLAHEMETLLGDIRSGARPADEITVDLLMAGTNALVEITEAVAEQRQIQTPVAGLIQSITALRNGGPIRPVLFARREPEMQAPRPSSGQPASAPDETLRVSTSKLDEVLNTASEVFVTRIRLQSDVAALTRAVADLQKIVRANPTSDARERSQCIEALALRLGRDLPTGADDRHQLQGKLREIIEISARVAENPPVSDELKLRVQKVDLLRKQLQKNVASLEGLSSRLQSGAMNFRMVPISQLFNRFPSLVRDMARKVGKRVRLDIEGSGTELDKVLTSQLVDPLIHIMRNALDHGVESPAERLSKGKPEIGRISLSACYEGSYVVIDIRDDGRGVDVPRVLARALESGLISAERARTAKPAEIMNLIFEPGFSTATTVTELSGRGVGMDMVRTAVQQMQGSVSLESEPGQGSRIRIKMPLTLAVVSVVLVEEHGYQFAIPVLNVVEVLAVPREEVRMVSGAMVTNFRGRTLPVTSLSAIMRFPPSSFFDDTLSIVVLTDGEREMGVLVDNLLGRHDVLIKQFGSLVARLPFLMGCTILSDSRLVSVLNVWELIHNKSEHHISSARACDSERAGARRQHAILVVDDSPIQRNRVAAALIRSGYRANTAEDGFDALCKIRERHYSACCVDVFMPLIDGLEFVERLREAPETKDRPVYMMSGAIEQLQDRHRLEQLGISGFFRKPFDVESLIHALDARLIESRAEETAATIEQGISA